MATFYPQFRSIETTITIVVAFLSPFLIVYSAFHSRPRRFGDALLTFFFAMVLLLLLYADIYQASGLVIDSAAEPEPRPIRTRQDALYFSVVTWTTLGYGDLQPHGFCRLVAAAEALTGNIFLGSFVGVLFISFGSNSNERG